MKAIGAGGAAATAGQGCGAGPAGGMPNILLITSDQQRKDSLRAYTDRAVTSPNLDMLATDGVIFDRCYTPHATCTPARASILTGQYASRHGAYTIGTTTPEDCLKMTDLLAAQGYATCGIGKMHFQPVSTEGKFESPPRIFDEEFWRSFDGPYYGFQWTRMMNRHTSEDLACRMRYAIWLKDHGLTEVDLQKYFHRQTGRWELPRDLHPSVFVAEHTIEAIDNCANREQPFFIWASFQDPHSPHVVPAPYDTMHDPNDIELLEHREGEFADKPLFYQQLYDRGGRQLPFSDRFGVPSCSSVKNMSVEACKNFSAVHHGMVTLLDEEVGRIVQALKERGLYDNTLIIFTTDHGDYLGNHGFRGKGFPAYEEVYNLPCIVKNPDQVNRGIRTQALLGTVDIAPTVLAAAGIGIPEVMQGVNQWGVLTGKQSHIRDSFMIEDRAVQTGFYQKMLVTDRFKLVAYMGETCGELYDLQQDPNQFVNLWEKSQHADRKQELLARLLAAGSEGNTRQYESKGSDALLLELTQQMQSEGPLQERTSYS
jgi:arylsulfatase A-like enzyme